MAEMDEDVIPRGPDVGDIDLSDETQDFRFLLNFTCVTYRYLWYILSLTLSPIVAMTPKSPKEARRTLNPTTPTNNQTP